MTMAEAPMWIIEVPHQVLLDRATFTTWLAEGLHWDTLRPAEQYIACPLCNAATAVDDPAAKAAHVAAHAADYFGVDQS